MPFLPYKSGCQWRMLPNDFPKWWQLVYYYYRKWSDLEEFDLLFSKLRERVWINMGQNEHQVQTLLTVKVSTVTIIVPLME